MVWSAFGASKLHLRSAGQYLTTPGVKVHYIGHGQKQIGLYYDQGHVLSE